ncbi:LysR family transcriptional regulator [Rhizobium leguminosarum bv. viciae]|nr:LysR family transcriptional regulator [Rhizobium leguminosarum]NKL12647.1 LysR family transcriptional regulator [Rhizobium leguminosarum bv. viciae]NKL41825.1 LysR family transcriptional regulator [Rhizobium leguminosarum bv. viciae]
MFKAVPEERSFTRAAVRFRVSQPALSHKTRAKLF